MQYRHPRRQQRQHNTNETYFNVAQNTYDNLTPTETSNFIVNSGSDGMGARIILDADSIAGGQGDFIGVGHASAT